VGVHGPQNRNARGPDVFSQAPAHEVSRYWRPTVFFATGTAPCGRAAGRSQSASDRVHEPGLHSGARNSLGKAAGASLRAKDQSFAVEESYRSDESVPGFQRYQPEGRSSRHCGERPLEPGARALPDRLVLSREAERASPPAVSQPLPTRHVYQRDSFPVTSLCQESAARLVGNVIWEGPVRKQFSVPRPLKLDAEMRSLRGEKRPVEGPREGKRRWGSFVGRRLFTFQLLKRYFIVRRL
jgi:hypothetical protein